MAITIDLVDFYHMLYQSERAELAALRAERDALRKDAERYRWLRERLRITKAKAMSGSVRDAISVRIGCDFLDSALPRVHPPEASKIQSKQLDAAIDAALAKDPT